MIFNSTTQALFNLLDDPDEEVYSLVATQIIKQGVELIPYLEDYLEAASNDCCINRTNALIHQLNFNSLTKELAKWNLEDNHDLLFGSNLIAKFIYPDLSIEEIIHSADKLRKNIWLELNDCLTSLEKVNVISNMLFYFHELKSERQNYSCTDNFFLHNLLKNKKGNAISISILYQHICERLLLPIKLINIPNQFVLACFQKDYKSNLHKLPTSNLILFYIDTITGNIFSQNDLDAYFHRYKIKVQESFFAPLSNQQILQKQLLEISRCFPNEQYHNRKKEFDILVSVLTSA